MPSTNNNNNNINGATTAMMNNRISHPQFGPMSLAYSHSNLASQFSEFLSLKIYLKKNFSASNNCSNIASIFPFNFKCFSSA